MGLFSALFTREQKFPGHASSYSYPTEDEPNESPSSSNDPDARFSGMRIGVIYEDTSGKQTKRIIRVKRIEGNRYNGLVLAFCELRNQERTFVVSRMLELFDPSTGENLPPPETFFGHFIDAQNEAEEEQFDRDRYRASWDVIQNLRDELQVLILIARADGRFAKAEQELILKYAASRAKDLSMPVDDQQLALLRSWLTSQDPSEPEIQMALKNLKQNPKALEGLWEVSQLVAEADGKVLAEELNSVKTVRDAIASL